MAHLPVTFLLVVSRGVGGVADQDGRCWATLTSYIQSEEVFEGDEDC